MICRNFSKVRFFLVLVVLVAFLFNGGDIASAARDAGNGVSHAAQRHYNGPYFGPYLNRVAFPIGGIGAGMVCLEGTGAISHVSVRNKPEVSTSASYIFAF
jgi:hypothetical protein